MSLFLIYLSLNNINLSVQWLENNFKTKSELLLFKLVLLALQTEPTVGTT